MSTAVCNPVLLKSQQHCEVERYKNKSYMAANSFSYYWSIITNVITEKISVDIVRSRVIRERDPCVELIPCQEKKLVEIIDECSFYS